MPIRFCLAFLLAFLFSCTPSAQNSPQPGTSIEVVPFTVLGSYQGTCSAGIEKNAEAFGNVEELNTKLRTLSEPGRNQTGLSNNIDFTNEVAIVIAVGPQSGGASATITSIVNDGRSVIVNYGLTHQAYGDFSISCPYTIAKIKKQVIPIMFKAVN